MLFFDRFTEPERLVSYLAALSMSLKQESHPLQDGFRM